MKPIVLGPNRLTRNYRGGGAIAELRGLPRGTDHGPEDWLASTTAAYGAGDAGLTRLPDGHTLRDAVRSNPEAFLGAAHVASFGADPGLLVKLLDPDERLPVHAHPDRDFAHRYLRSDRGKTEAWIVVGTREEVEGKPCVYLGFRDDVDIARLAGLVRSQDSGGMLDLLNPVPVGPGDAVLVPAGIPHTIGAGVFVVELQEPTDLSILLEWQGFAIDGRRDKHLGLPADVAMQAVDRSGWTPERLAGLRAGRPDAEVAHGRYRLLPEESDQYFRVERLSPDPTVTLDPSFAVLVTLRGAGTLTTELGDIVQLVRGSTVLVPFAAGATTVSGDVEVVRCLPPVSPPTVSEC